ncbi:MAG: flagellar biosynthetic protein FliQ [Deltaproteobacteria bacterium]|nr:flagellar biosynthetic protein FliQ [Deltaproteobacteria bacterium]
MILEEFTQIATYGIQTAILVSLPPLLMGLVAGILISIVQAATQINDSALAFLPKILATVAALLIFGSWMISEMANFSTYTFNQIPNVTM